MGKPAKWKKRNDNMFFCQDNFQGGCGKSYASSEHMKRHHDTIHDGKRFVCSGYSPCQKDFYSLQRLHDHMYFVHTNPEAGKCIVCEISFTTKVASVNHFESELHNKRKNQQAKNYERDELFGVPSSSTATTVKKIPVCPLYENKINIRPGDVETFKCIKKGDHNECRGAYERYFGQKKGNVTVGYEFEVVGHHDCKSSWYVYTLGDKRNPKTRYVGKSERTPGCISTLTTWRETEEKNQYGGRRMTDDEYKWWSSLIRLKASNDPSKRLPVKVELRKVIKYFVHPSRSILDLEFNIIVEYNPNTMQRDELTKVEEWYIQKADCYNEETGGLNDPSDDIFVEREADAGVLSNVKLAHENKPKRRSSTMSPQEAAKKKKEIEGNSLRKFFNARPKPEI